MNRTKITKTDQEWKAELTPLQFEVTCKHGTERAMSWVARVTALIDSIMMRNAMLRPRPKLAAQSLRPT